MGVGISQQREEGPDYPSFPLSPTYPNILLKSPPTHALGPNIQGEKQALLGFFLSSFFFSLNIDYFTR